MAIALEIGVGNLVAEFLAHTLILLRSGQAAGAVAPCALQTLADGLDDLGILVETYLHTVLLRALERARCAVSINRGC